MSFFTHVTSFSELDLFSSSTFISLQKSLRYPTSANHPLIQLEKTNVHTFPAVLQFCVQN